MRYVARIWPMLTALAAFLLIRPLCGQPADWQSGIARITTRQELKRSPGTAFVVSVQNGNAYLVTSAHVVEGDQSAQVEFRNAPEKVYPATVRVIEAGEERGLALLVVSGPPSGVRAIPESSQPLILGSSVTVAGFPASLNSFSVLDTTVSALRGRDLFLSRETDEGFSGGPVLGSGAVVGIVYGRDPGFGKALGGSSIKPFIEGNDLVWGSTSGPNQTATGTQALAPKEPAAGQTRENTKDRLTYVWIPPGMFTMGCSPGDSECYNDETPPHEVTITRGFWLGKTEVPVAAYSRFLQVPEGNNTENPGMPVVYVNWAEAKAYCEWAGLRLPSEAEWEYAARANTTGPRYGALDDVAWRDGNSGGKAHPVSVKQPNAWGLYDMLGNAFEWVEDWYGERYYEQKASVNPAGPPSGQNRVLRGGSWNFLPRYIRASYRGWVDPSRRADDIGFRCAGELR